MSTVLIVDDHAEALYLLRCMLEAEGFAVVEASHGREALDAAARQPLDLIVSDILMPVMDGFNLCRIWKSDPRLRQIPFVFYTATYVDKADEELGLSLGADLFLVKPIEPQVLMAKLREVLAPQREGGHAPVEPPDAQSVPFLRQYNEVLVHKLEDKLAQLEKANQALRLKDLALASSRNGVVLAAEQGEIVYSNETMLRLCGKRAADVVGKPVRDLLPAGSGFPTWLAQGESCAPLEVELPVPGATPTTRWLRIEKHPVSDAVGGGQGIMLLCADVTQELRLRHDLARVQRFEALSLFAAGVAHDFNNLLMAIFSVLEIDRSEKIAPDERRENRAMAHAAFERARDLTRRLVSFAKHGPTERRPADVRQLLDESIALSLSGSGVACEKRYGDVPAIVCVDAGQMAQVFGNLLVNARQAMGDQGKIVVTVRSLLSTSLAGTSPRPAVEVAIRDTGPGIPAEILPNIFEPYFTTKEEGSGLGLATSRAIVLEHGGEISVHSQPGAGTSFEVTIPAATGPVALPVPEPPLVLAAHTGRLLVMDDQPAILTMLRRGLERAGYAIVTAAEGVEAVREFEKAKQVGEAFDLILLDIFVQGGMGGAQALAEIRRSDPSVLAIAMTGSISETSTDELLERGFTRVVRKPFLLHELYATIKAVLGHA